MFEDALLESSPRRTSVLRRIHYLFSAFAGALVFAPGLCLLPLLLATAGERALFIAAAVMGGVAALYALMLCYVWADTQQQHLRTWPWLGVTLLLNLPGFLIYLVYSAQKTGDWKRAAIPLAYVAESMFVGVLILVPLIYTQALPRQWLISELRIPSPPPGPPPGRPAGRPAPPPRHPKVDAFTQPVRIPPTIATIVEPPEPPQLEAGPEGPFVPGVPGGLGTGSGYVPGSVPWGTPAPPPPPQVVHTAPKQRLYRVGGDVIAARALYQPRPVYPPLAMMAHIQGTVVLQAIIGKDGTIQDLKVISGHPLLVRAALDAVRTWRYQATLLNSEPVEVLTEIDVNFRLGE
jgi:protein TonB